MGIMEGNSERSIIISDTCIQRCDQSFGCNNPSTIAEQAVMRAGITCQTLFEKAYAHYGYHDSYARAVFVKYIDTNAKKLPPTVNEECERIMNNLAGSAPTKRSCLACTLNRKAWGGAVLSYRLIHPTVTKETLCAVPSRCADEALSNRGQEFPVTKAVR